MAHTSPNNYRLQQALRAISWCSVLLTTAIVLAPQSMKPHVHARTPVSFSGKQRFIADFFHKEQAATSGEEGVLPTVLGEADRTNYRAIFAAQKRGDWKTADLLIEQIKNDVLMGTVLAERYRHPNYRTTAAELVAWMDRYNDHPQAAAMHELAMAKDAKLRDAMPFVEKSKSLAKYGDIFSLPQHAYHSPHQGLWNNGLTAWRQGRKAEAAKYFADMASKRDDLSPWMSSAAAYWAHRAYKAGGNAKAASEYLHMAAENPRTFYGVIARKQLGMPLGLDTQPVQLTEDDVLTMVGDQSARRVVALTEAGMNDMAELELRTRFPQADQDEKTRLLALAHELGLASVQISMAHDLAVVGREMDFARYPIPNWQPDGGFRVDPLLIFSLMRQESGFQQTAVSPVGALGLMQLMPQTAALVHKQMFGGEQQMTRGSASDPIMNLTLGQNYVETLLVNPLVEGNLFYLLAAYNAGPGRLQEWKGNLNYKNDPLLFVESIPFPETHHYVMQVMTNYWIYSELVGGNDRSVHALVAGRWPAYAAEGTPLAEALTPSEAAISSKRKL